VLGKDPIPDLLIVEDHGHALAEWAEKGIRDAVVVNIDTHDDIRLIPEEKIGKLKELYRQKDWKGLAEAASSAGHGLYNVGNWIYAGSRLGMFREVYWVIPYTYFSQSNAEDLLRQFLKSGMFSAEDIQTFTLKDNRFRGTFHGIPIILCDLESLPGIEGPLLLSVDTDFFPVFTSQYRINYLSALDRMFSLLFSSNYRIQDAVVSYSVNGEFLQPHLRWVGNELATVLMRPAVLNEPPAPLVGILQQVDDAYRSVSYAEMFKLIDKYQSPSPEASLLLYKAYAHMLQGDSEKALKAAQESCKADSLYCTGLPYIGAVSFVKDQCDDAVKFFSAGYSADPDMRNGLYYYAHCLRDLGKTEEALAYYNKDVQLNGSFPTEFLIFETYLLSGEKDAAMAALKIAVSSLESNPYAEVVNEKAAHAIYSALDYCKKNGLKKMADTLEGNAAVKKMFDDYPRG